MKKKLFNSFLQKPGTIDSVILRPSFGRRFPRNLPTFLLLPGSFKRILAEEPGRGISRPEHSGRYFAQKRGSQRQVAQSDFHFQRVLRSALSPRRRYPLAFTPKPTNSKALSRKAS